jgi:Ni,Fe-hydrogenase I small subunit
MEGDGFGYRPVFCAEMFVTAGFCAKSAQLDRVYRPDMMYSHSIQRPCT